MNPDVSIVVPTYARTALLCEVVECFRRLTYAGAAELVILNDCDRQTLTCDVPLSSNKSIRIINQPTFPTFGHKINALYQAASHSLVMRVDDDDLFLPDMITVLTGLLATFDRLADAEVPAARCRQLLVWNGQQMVIRSASAHHCAITRRSAFFAAGGVRHLSADLSDAEFWPRVTPQWFRGRWHHENDGHLLGICRAEPDRVRVSRGDADFQAAHIARINIGEEPSGVIPLIPSWSRDWQAEADAVQKVTRHE